MNKLFNNDKFNNFVENNDVLSYFFCDRSVSALWINSGSTEVFMFRNGYTTLEFTFDCGAIHSINTHKSGFSSVLTQEGWNLETVDAVEYEAH